MDFVRKIRNRQQRHGQRFLVVFETPSVGRKIAECVSDSELEMTTLKVVPPRIIKHIAVHKVVASARLRSIAPSRRLNEHLQKMPVKHTVLPVPPDHCSFGTLSAHRWDVTDSRQRSNLRETFPKDRVYCAKIEALVDTQRGEVIRSIGVTARPRAN